jgi:C-methyltransferase
MTMPAAHALAEIVRPWATARDELQILDVACGNGIYSLTLASQHPDAHTTLLDWSNVLELTRANVERMALTDRTAYIEGDFFEVPLGGPYDLIVASHFFHHFSEERCLELAKRLRQALKPGGRLAINDFVPSESGDMSEPFPFLFSVVMLTWTHEGEAYPLSAYERFLTEAGFGQIEAHPSIGMPSTFVLATADG